MPLPCWRSHSTKPNEGATAAEVPGQIGTCKTDLIFLIHIRVEGDDHAAAFPDYLVEIRNWTFDVDPLAVGSAGLADRATPIEDTPYADW